MSTTVPPTAAAEVFAALEIEALNLGVSDGAFCACGGAELTAYNPATGDALSRVGTATVADVDAVVACAADA